MTGTNKPVASLKVTTDAWESLFRAQVAVMRQITAMPEFGKLSMREYDVLFNLRTCPWGQEPDGRLEQAIAHFPAQLEPHGGPP